MAFGNRDQIIARTLSADWFSIIILTAAAILFVTAELLPVGILSDIANSFHQPIGKVGLMVTGYAWTVALSAIVVTHWLTPLERRNLLLLLLTIFAIANLLVACAPSLIFLFVARVVSAFSHGVFWSIVGSLCVRLAGPLPKARATALVFGGIAVATVITVPLGTVLASWLGWRAAFSSIAGLSLVIAIAMYWRFPRLTNNHHLHDLRHLSALTKQPLLRRLCPATVLALTGHFCAFTYVSLLLEKIIGISPSYLAVYLFLFGLAGVVGNFLAGMLSDRRLHQASQWVISGMAIAIILSVNLPVNAKFLAPLLIVIWGAGIVILTVTLQSLILTLPESMTEAASSVHVSTFNIGIGSGALLGGILVDHFTLPAVAWTGGIMLFVAAIILTWPRREVQLLIKENQENME